MSERRAQAFAVVIILIAGLGFVVERRLDWAGLLLRLVGADLVFLTNWALEVTAVLTGFLWRAASERKARVRSLLLSMPLLSVALWSYAWYFAPLPDPLSGTLDPTGFCPQSTPDSCSAAAAVMLLHLYNIQATEAEMARLCLTRAGTGTPTLGLIHGLEYKAQNRGWHVHCVQLDNAGELAHLHPGCIVLVGLKRGLPPKLAARMQSYGWEPGVHHAVVVLGTDTTLTGLDVADPSNGHEQWPLRDVEPIWEGQALLLTR